jgi:DNA-binding NtrC family response regulator
MNSTDVLVVDDDFAVCRIVQRMLSNEQCKVQTSLSVFDAVVALEEKSFDAYVVNYKLPDGSGLDVAERIRSKWGAVPIILMWGYNPRAVALRAERLGSFDFLQKPFSREMLCEAVKKAIASQEASKLSSVAPPAAPVVSKRAEFRFWRFFAKRSAS